ncbi:hypothetical protein [Halobacterium rubrum]|uniref:hypothetical protein n=1 Tax=Halobacterium TaxID=2239 RepID=UPI001F27A41B|nr:MULTISPECIES: hypothetical protein [Halobacterium]MDH5021814.1 hypothetical protein [Halobacterium rubrum]
MGNDKPNPKRRAVLKLASAAIGGSLFAHGVSADSERTDDREEANDHWERLTQEHGSWEVIEYRRSGTDKFPEPRGKSEAEQDIEFEDGYEITKKVSVRGNGNIFTEFDGSEYRLKIDSDDKNKMNKRIEENQEKLEKRRKKRAEKRNQEGN